MRIAERWENGGKIVVIGADAGEVVIKDVQSALDLLIAAKYEHQADRIAIDKGAVADAFFILSTGMAGEILQKFINYGAKLAVFGDFSRYKSQPLRDFMRESNQGKDVFFTADEEEAVRRLRAV